MLTSEEYNKIVTELKMVMTLNYREMREQLEKTIVREIKKIQTSVEVDFGNRIEAGLSEKEKWQEHKKQNAEIIKGLNRIADSIKNPPIKQNKGK